MSLGYALLIGFVVLISLVGIVRGRFVRSDWLLRPKPVSRKKIVAYCNRLRFMPEPTVPGISTTDLARELTRLLALVALNPDRQYPVDGAVREGWNQLVRQPDLFRRISRNLFGKYGSVQQERLPVAFAGDIEALYSGLYQDYENEFGEKLPPRLWSDRETEQVVPEEGELFLVTADLSPLKKVTRRDGEHLKTDYFGGMGDR